MATATENGHAPVPDENTAPDAAPAEEKEQKEQNEEQDEQTEQKDEKTETNGENDDDKIITVFHDPENFNVKHPLMHEWTLWFTKPPSSKVRSAPPVHFVCGLELTVSAQGDNWNDLLKEVVTFGSVEEFWGIYVCSPCPNPLL